MNPRPINQLLRLATAAMVVISVTLLLAGVMRPMEKEAPTQTASRGSSARDAKADASAIPSLNEFEPIWNLPLRKSLGGAPAPIVQTPAPASDAPLTLVGTVGNSL